MDAIIEQGIKDYIEENGFNFEVGDKVTIPNPTRQYVKREVEIVGIKGKIISVKFGGEVFNVRLSTIEKNNQGRIKNLISDKVKKDFNS